MMQVLANDIRSTTGQVQRMSREMDRRFSKDEPNTSWNSNNNRPPAGRGRGRGRGQNGFGNRGSLSNRGGRGGFRRPPPSGPPPGHQDWWVWCKNCRKVVQHNPDKCYRTRAPFVDCPPEFRYLEPKNDGGQPRGRGPQRAPSVDKSTGGDSGKGSGAPIQATGGSKESGSGKA